MAGDVLIRDRPITKAGASVDIRDEIRLRKPPHPYVGRGGVKLRGVMDELEIDVSGMVCADIGSSTGGFTHCLLLAGARRVYAIDVDTAQLDWKLQKDKRVIPIKGNARYLLPRCVPEYIDFVTVDVSFISVTKILEPLTDLLKDGGRCLALIKPQFELGKGKVGKGGIVKDPKLHAEAVQKVIDCMKSIGFVYRRVCPSVIKGKEGNQEFFLFLNKQ